MNIPGPDALQRDEQARYLKKRGVDPSQFAPDGKDPDAGIDSLTREDVIEHLPNDVDIGEVESALPDGVHTIDELTQDDLEGMADEYREIVEEAKPEPTPKELTWWRKAWWMLSGTFYTLVVAALDLEQVHAGRVAHSIWFARHGTKGSVSINWAVSQVNPGGTVFLPAQGPDTNNRWELDQWIDIDRDNVTLEGEGWNRTLLYVEDGANVGGIRVGVDSSSTRTDITISNIGYDGNEDGQDQLVKRLHGVIIENARRARVEECFFTRTSPFDEHGSGGSGITVRKEAREVTLDGNRADEIGDRFIQVSGEEIRISGTVATNGFDRTISMNVTEPDGLSYQARNVTVVGNVGITNPSGSIIGCAGDAQRNDRGYYTIIGNLGLGEHRSLITMRTGHPDHVVAVGNVGVNGGAGDDPGIQFLNVEGGYIGGNLLKDYDGTQHGYSGGSTGILYSGGTGSVSNNIVIEPDGIGIDFGATNGTASNNIVKSPGTTGIVNDAGGTSISENSVIEAGGDGIVMNAVALPAILSCNIVDQSNVDGEGSAEYKIDDSELLAIGNRVSARNAGTCFSETSNANKNIYVGNRGDNAIANMWYIQGSHSWGYANYPALADDEGSVTLTGGVGAGSEAARINGVSSTEGMNLVPRVQPDLSGTQPDADYATDEYLEWDASAGAWDLVIEWRTDPGSDVSALYEVTREPTSRAVKNA